MSVLALTGENGIGGALTLVEGRLYRERLLEGRRMVGPEDVEEELIGKFDDLMECEEKVGRLIRSLTGVGSGASSSSVRPIRVTEFSRSLPRARPAIG